MSHVVIWAALICGGCAREFLADPERVPCLLTLPVCLPCWNRRNLLRRAAGLAEQDRPPAYPADYPPEADLSWLR